MFFVGLRKDVSGYLTQTLRERILAEINGRRVPHRTLRSIISEFGPAGAQGNPATCTAKVVFAKSPILRKSPYAGMMFNGAGRPVPLDGASPTLPASMGGNKTPIVDEAEIFDGENSFIEGYHARLMAGGKSLKGEAPKRLRRLTIKECAAIQTFPENYAFQGAKSSIYKQIGNAVPCRLAAVVANSLKAILIECEAAQITELVAAE
jgi:DNA (cytosine-5)-methyltransferase 1